MVALCCYFGCVKARVVLGHSSFCWLPKAISRVVYVSASLGAFVALTSLLWGILDHKVIAHPTKPWRKHRPTLASMSDAEDDDGLEAPQAGWPPQLQYAVVLDTQRKSKAEYKFRCLKCGYKSGFSTLLRVAAHHLRVKGKGIQLCTMKATTLEALDPTFVAMLRSSYPSLMKGGQTTLSFAAPSPRSAATSIASGSGVGSAANPLSIDVPPSNVSSQLTIQWATKPEEEKKAVLAQCHKDWSLFFFVNNIPFSTIDSKYFKRAIKSTKECPIYEPVRRYTLSTAHLNARDNEATEYREAVITKGLEFGLWMSGDGYKSKPTKRQWHNYILGCALGDPPRPPPLLHVFSFGGTDFLCA